MKLIYNSIILLFAIAFLPASVNAQIKGKAKHLPGIWKYEAGTGYEIWEMNGNTLNGRGYRVNKLGDSVLVETITILYINKNLSFKLETPQLDSLNNASFIGRYIGDGKKLDFRTIEGKMPERIRYKFGFFSKKKLKILMYNMDGDDAQKIVLRKV